MDEIDLIPFRIARFQCLLSLYIWKEYLTSDFYVSSCKAKSESYTIHWFSVHLHIRH